MAAMKQLALAIVLFGGTALLIAAPEAVFSLVFFSFIALAFLYAMLR